MTQYKEQAHIRDIQKEVIIHAIEAISEGLVQDAKYNYGREAGYSSKFVVDESGGMVFCEVKFLPYDYKFRWLAEKEKDGYLITFVGAVPDAWHEFMTNRSGKLKGLMDTQWAAFLNFCIGFVTCNYYVKHAKTKKPKKQAREHIKSAKKRVVKRKKTKKSKID